MTNKNSYLVLLLVFAVTFISACNSEQTPSTVNVSGDATFRAPVDYLVMQIGVTEKSSNRSQAEQQGYETAHAIKIFLSDELGVSDSLLTTPSSSLRESYQRPGEPQQYEFNQVFTAQLDSVDWFDSIRKRLVDIGASEVHLQEYGSSQLEQYQEKAHRQAYRKARQQAQLLSESSGMEIIKPLQISSSADHTPAPRTAPVKIQNDESFTSERESSLSQSYIEVRAQVQVEFMLE
ncbi:MAG: SIMPL domain-containing protein [Bacteroidota bacterium]